MATTDQKILEVVLELKDKLSPALKKTGDNAKKSMAQVGKSMTTAGASMTRNVTLPVIAMGTAILSTALTFDKSMRKVGALTGATGRDFEKLRDQAKELGRTTVYSASEAAEGMGFLGMAGFETTEIMKAMPGVLDMAAAGAVDLGVAADISSNILSGFGLEATEMGRVADVLANTFSSANVDLRMLGDTMKFAAPMAKDLGISLEETAAVAGIMGDAGIQAGIAGRSMRSAFVRLVDPPKEAAAAIKALNLQLWDSEGKFLSVEDMVRQLEGSLADLTDQQRLAALAAIFGKESVSAWSIVIGEGADAVRDLTQANIDAEGKAKELAERMSTEWEKMKSALQGAFIAIADAGLMDKLTVGLESFTDFLTHLAETDPATLNALTNVFLALAVVGPVASVLAPVVGFIGKMGAAGAGGAAAAGTGLSAAALGVTALSAAIAVFAIADIVLITALINELGSTTREEWNSIIEYITGGFAEINRLTKGGEQSLADYDAAWDRTHLNVDGSVKDIGKSMETFKMNVADGMPYIASIVDENGERIKIAFNGADEVIATLTGTIGEMKDSVVADLPIAEQQFVDSMIEMERAGRAMATTTETETVRTFDAVDAMVAGLKTVVSGFSTWLVWRSVWPDMWSEVLSITEEYGELTNAEIKRMMDEMQADINAGVQAVFSLRQALVQLAGTPYNINVNVNVDTSALDAYLASQDFYGFNTQQTVAAPYSAFNEVGLFRDQANQQQILNSVGTAADTLGNAFESINEQATKQQYFYRAYANDCGGAGQPP